MLYVAANRLAPFPPSIATQIFGGGHLIYRGRTASITTTAQFKVFHPFL